MPITFLFLVLILPGAEPITKEVEMESAFACAQEVTHSVLRWEAMRKPGKFQASCIVVGPEKELEAGH